MGDVLIEELKDTTSAIGELMDEDDELEVTTQLPPRPVSMTHDERHLYVVYDTGRSYRLNRFDHAAAWEELPVLPDTEADS